MVGETNRDRMDAVRDGERGTLCGVDTTTHSRTTVAHRWLWKCVLTLSQKTYGGGWCVDERR